MLTLNAKAAFEPLETFCVDRVGFKFSPGGGLQELMGCHGNCCCQDPRMGCFVESDVGGLQWIK